MRSEVWLRSSRARGAERRLRSARHRSADTDGIIDRDSSFNRGAAARGKGLFEGKAKCSTCHVPPLYTEPGWNMHPPEEIGIDNFQSERAPDRRYRTSPLKGLFAHDLFAAPANQGRFFHDGRFLTLLEVVSHYNDHGVGNGGVPLGLTPAEKADLVEFLKSL